MSAVREEDIKRWTARRKSALALEIIQGKTTVADASRQFDLRPAEIEEWIDQAKAGMENALRAKPEDVREQYERQLKDLQKAYGGLKADGVEVTISQLSRWFSVPRRSVYYRQTKSSPKIQTALAEPIKKMIEQEPSFRYRTVADLLHMNKNTVQRIFQLNGWQVRKRAVGSRPRIEAKISVAERPDERWATDLCRVWGGVAMVGWCWPW